MKCPHCQTENRPDRGVCYHCEADISLLCTVVNKARNHFNTALELAGRDRTTEAIGELKSALELDSAFAQAWVVLGTLHAREGRRDEAVALWNRALSLDPNLQKAHDYIGRIELTAEAEPRVRALRRTVGVLALCVTLLGIALIAAVLPENFGELAHEAFSGRSSVAAAAAIVLLPLAAGLAFRIHQKRGAVGALIAEIFTDRK